MIGEEQRLVILTAYARHPPLNGAAVSVESDRNIYPCPITSLIDTAIVVILAQLRVGQNLVRI